MTAPAPDPAPEAGPGRPLRVLSYNIKELKVDEDAVVDVLRASGADVVAVQEATRHPTGRRRMRRLAARAGMRCLVPGGGPCGSFTTAILVSAETEARVVRAVGRPLPWRWWYRRARLVWPTRRGYALVDLGDVAVLSVHLGLDARERADHCARLLDVVDGLGADRCVVAGDLNETPDGPSWQTLGTRLHDAGAATDEVTFSVASPRRRIDAVLVGAAVAADAVRVVTSDAARRGSDHLPLLAHLRVTS